MCPESLLPKSLVDRPLPTAMPLMLPIINLTLDLAQTRSPLLVGRVRIEGVARSVLRTLEFDLSNLLSVSFVISSEGTVLPWEHRTDRVFVQLPETLQAGDFYALDLVYEGDPQGTGFGSFESIRNDAVYPDITMRCILIFCGRYLNPTEPKIGGHQMIIHRTKQTPSVLP